ncbi:MAG TPA: hypothetical protein VHV82_10315 [Sporichthyaceae bacterium]|jgi:hypothetical protein|nr:hypothetical protein [Sporichthyaceae bacterium]
MTSPPAASTSALSGVIGAVGIAALCVVAALIGQAALVVPVLGAQVLLVLGWYSVIGVPGWELGAGLAIGCGLVGDLAMVVRGDDPSLGPLAGVLGPGVLGAIAVQLLRRDGRARLTASITAACTAAVLSVLGATLVAERGSTQGRAVTVVAVVAAGVATAVLASPMRAEVAEALAVPAAVLVAGVLAGPVGDLEIWHVLVIAFAAAVLAAAGRRAAAFAAYDLAHRPLQPAAEGAGGGRAAGRAARRAAAREARRSGDAILVLGSALPFVLASPASYVLGRLLVG